MVDHNITIGWVAGFKTKDISKSLGHSIKPYRDVS